MYALLDELRTHAWGTPPLCLRNLAGALRADVMRIAIDKALDAAMVEGRGFRRSAFTAPSWDFERGSIYHRDLEGWPMLEGCVVEDTWIQ